MLQYSIRAAISAISLSQWAVLHLFPSVAHILFTCWCDESICFVTLSGVLCLGAVYWSALWEVADAAVETFLFFFFFIHREKKKKKRDSCFFNPYKCQKTEKQTWIPFAVACVAVCHADCSISTDMYTRAKWKKQLSKLKIWNGEKWESSFPQWSPVGPRSLLKAHFNGSKYTLFWILSLQRMWFYPPSRTPAT